MLSSGGGSVGGRGVSVLSYNKQVSSIHSVTHRVIMHIFIIVTIIGMVTVGVTKGNEEGEEDGGHRSMLTSGKRDKRSAGTRRQNMGPTSDELTNILRAYENNQINSDLLRYTPTTPSPDDVNCHVEIPVTQQVGGRCVNLGSFVGCQAGIYLAFDSSCNQQLGIPQSGPRRSPPSFGQRRNPFRQRSYNNRP